MISVVVPTYNEEKNIERCLQSLHSQTIPRESIEIIVVDGDSLDRTREIAEPLADKVIIQTSIGVGGARNDGFNVAEAPLVATTDAYGRYHITCAMTPSDQRGSNFVQLLLRFDKDIVA